MIRALSTANVKLLPGLFSQRVQRNRDYMLGLTNAHLLQNHYLEAGVWSSSKHECHIHGGWESPTCQLRGHFLGHWLSAAASMIEASGDAEIKAKADTIVTELKRCQQENGGTWAGSIPEKYLDWIAKGKHVWAPHYTLHKTLMGLVDMATRGQNDQALHVLTNWATWFHRWTGQFSRSELDDILDVETGGMLEVWADLYGITGDTTHRELMERYDRPRLFEPLVAGDDVLTNQHANTTIPEVHGAARAWEVTGEQRWRDIVEAYWRLAVTEREAYCTGGQTCGEVWTPPGELSARLGDKNQEFCTVYNMMRLADYLWRWTGDFTYGDYWERNLWNGILAQQHAETGMIAYFLPLEANAAKKWGSPTQDFWCCHGTLVQAHATHRQGIYYQDDEGLILQQYVPSELQWKFSGVDITVTQQMADQREQTRRPQSVKMVINICAQESVTFTVKLRIPWWVQTTPTVSINQQPDDCVHMTPDCITIHRNWGNDTIELQMPKSLTSCSLPDQPDQRAFLDGPVVLAGLVNEQRTLSGDGDDPTSFLIPDNEREWEWWKSGYRTYNQERNFRFLPLYQVQDERYTVYFPTTLPSYESSAQPHDRKGVCPPTREGEL